MRLGLKAAILQRGLSQRETSRLSDIPENKLSSIIRGWTEAGAAARRSRKEEVDVCVAGVS